MPDVIEVTRLRDVEQREMTEKVSRAKEAKEDKVREWEEKEPEKGRRTERGRSGNETSPETTVLLLLRRVACALCVLPCLFYHAP